jgi:hypothetical protein
MHSRDVNEARTSGPNYPKDVCSERLLLRSNVTVVTVTCLTSIGSSMLFWTSTTRMAITSVSDFYHSMTSSVCLK